MALLNARSIRNKWLEFRAIIFTTPVEIIGITETWVDTDDRDFEGENRFPCYLLFHLDRTLYGGLCEALCKVPSQPCTNTDCDSLRDSESNGPWE